MMDISACTTIVLVLLWLSLCCNVLGFLVTLIDEYRTTSVIPVVTTLSTVLLGLCLWQCKKAGYLVTPMTWYHWVLLLLLTLLILLQIVAVVLEQAGWGLWSVVFEESTYPIYAIAAVISVILVILGGTLYCGWKCNLFCRPCCKSQYICYGSAVVVVLVVLTILAMTVSMVQIIKSAEDSGSAGGINEIRIIGYLGKLAIPITHCYSTAMIWNTIVKLPYTIPEVASLLTSALALASILALAAPRTSMEHISKLPNTSGYPLLALHIVSTGITLYCLEYKGVFYWPKDYMCFGVLAVVVILVALVLVVIHSGRQHSEPVEYILLGYSFLLMVPTFWYAYRCGLLTWRWSCCLPKKKGLKATDTAENTTADTDIAKES